MFQRIEGAETTATADMATGSLELLSGDAKAGVAVGAVCVHPCAVCYEFEASRLLMVSLAADAVKPDPLFLRGHGGHLEPLLITVADRLRLFEEDAGEDDLAARFDQ